MNGIDIGSFGIWRRVGEITNEMASETEELGFGAIWVGGSPPGDLEIVEEILDVTERIPVITGIVNMWREEASPVAASHLRITDRHPGRFFLGLGVGHPEATSQYSNPLDKIDDYLDEVVAQGVPGDEIVLAALGPKVLKIAAERTAGAHPYLTTPRHTRMAREVMGEGPLLAPEHKVLLGMDDETAVAKGRETVRRYLRLDNYRRNLRREGWESSDFEDGGSDRLVRALVLSGSAEEVAAGLRAHLESGADHVGIQVLGDDPIGAHRRLAEILL